MAFIFLNVNENAEVPKLAEPWFLAFDAAVDFQPVMAPGDLAKAGPNIAEEVKKFG